MNLAFTKMQGAGNDFVVIDATSAPFDPDHRLLSFLTDRHFGVGCDQVLVVDPPPSAEFDFGYRIYNADGSQVGQCGNGARCLARFVAEHKLSAKPDLKLRTTTSTLAVHRLVDGRVRVDMGAPRFEPSAIPLIAGRRESHYELMLDDGSRLRFGAAGMGNPHAVIAVDDIDTAAVEHLGQALQRHPMFPESVNVGFLQVVDRGQASLRVYERGAGETLACGSGACAAFAVAREWDLLDSRAEIAVTGGKLLLEWAGGTASIFMTGPATTVFEGRIEWSN